MSRVDEELAAAVRESEEVARAEPAPSAPAPLIRPTAKRSVGLLAALLVVGGGILTLVFTTVEGATVFDRPVDQLVKERDKLVGRPVRVEGELKKGSLMRPDQPCEYRFTIAKSGSELPVRFAQCVVPDTFRDMPNMDVTVIATGTLDEAGHFEASNIMTQCPSKYEMKERANKGEAAPHMPVTAPLSPKI